MSNYLTKTSFIVLTVLTVLLFPTLVLADSKEQVNLSGIEENGRTLVPMRALFENLGATVNYDAKTQTITVIKDQATIILKPNNKRATKNGQTILLDVPAKLVEGRTYVPARFVAESLGYYIGWNQQLKQATVKRKDKIIIVSVTVVDNMKNLQGNTQQIILVTANGYNTSSAKIQTFEKSNGNWKRVMNTSGYIGKNGFSDNKREGDGKTPTGKYTIGDAFGYKGNPGTKLNFRSSTSNDVWVDDPRSNYYNTWQKNNRSGKDWNSAESMMHRLYEYGLVINYNTKQVPNKGSAIFLHVGNSYTLGCVATSQNNVISMMKWIDPKKNPVIIMTPESQLSEY